MKIIVITWQSYYNMFYKVSKKIKDLNIKVYSARVLEKEGEKLKAVLDEIKGSDLLLVYRSTQESFWEILEKEIREGKIDKKIVYLSSDPSFWTYST